MANYLSRESRPGKHVRWLTFLILLQPFYEALAQPSLTQLRQEALLTIASDRSGIAAGIALETSHRLANARDARERAIVAKRAADTVARYASLTQAGNGQAIVDDPIGSELGLRKYFVEHDAAIRVFASYSFPYELRPTGAAYSIQAANSLGKVLHGLPEAEQKRFLSGLVMPGTVVANITPTSNEGKALLESVLKAAAGDQHSLTALTAVSQAYSAKVLSSAIQAGSNPAGDIGTQLSRFSSLLCAFTETSIAGQNASLADTAKRLGALANLTDQITFSAANPSNYNAVGLALTLASQAGFLNPQGGQEGAQMAEALKELTAFVREQFQRLNTRLDKIDGMLSLIYDDLRVVRHLQESTLVSINALLTQTTGIIKRLDQLEENVLTTIREAGLVECEAYLLPQATRPKLSVLNRCLLAATKLAGRNNAGFDFASFKRLTAAEQESAAETLAIAFGNECRLESVVADLARKATCSDRLSLLAALITRDAELEAGALAMADSDRVLMARLYAARTLIELDRRWGSAPFRENLKSRSAEIEQLAGAIESGSVARQKRHAFNVKNAHNLAEYFVVAASNAARALESAGDVGPLQNFDPDSPNCWIYGRAAGLSRVQNCWKRTSPRVMLGEDAFLDRLRRDIDVSGESIAAPCVVVNPANQPYNTPQSAVCPFASFRPVIGLQETDPSFAGILTSLRAVAPQHASVSISANQVWPLPADLVIRHIVTLRYSRQNMGSGDLVLSTVADASIPSPGANPSNVAIVSASISQAVRHLTSEAVPQIWAGARYLWAPIVSRFTFDAINGTTDVAARRKIVDAAIGWSEALNMVIFEAWSGTGWSVFAVGNKEFQIYRSCVTRVYDQRMAQQPWQSRLSPVGQADLKSTCNTDRLWARFDVLTGQERPRPVSETVRMWFEGESDRIWNLLPQAAALPKDRYDAVDTGAIPGHLRQLTGNSRRR